MLFYKMLIMRIVGLIDDLLFANFKNVETGIAQRICGLRRFLRIKSRLPGTMPDSLLIIFNDRGIKKGFCREDQTQRRVTTDR